MEKPRSWVYFIQAADSGPIKIGFTTGDPRSRMASLQTGNPHPLRLLVVVPGTPEDEGSLHERFAQSRMQGEWFAPSPILIAFILGAQMAGRPLPPNAAYEGRLYDEHEEHARYTHIWQLVRRGRWLCKKADMPLAPALRAEMADILDDLTDMLDQAGECVDWFGRDTMQEVRNELRYYIEREGSDF